MFEERLSKLPRMGSKLREMLAAGIIDVSRLNPSAMEDLVLIFDFSVSLYINSDDH